MSESFQHPKYDSFTPCPLTEREKEVLQAASEPGITWRDVAAKLGISNGTLNTHRNNIFQKLGVTKRHAALMIYRSYPDLN